MMSKRTASLWAFPLFMAGLAASAAEVPTVEQVPDRVGDRMPLHTVVPKYPEAARRARLEGEVEVCFNVDHFGRTSRVAVRRSTNRIFEKPARDAVRESSYQPLPDGQKLSGIKTCRTFRFILTPAAGKD